MPNYTKQLEAVRESNIDMKIVSLIAHCKRLHINDPIAVARYGINHDKSLKSLGYMAVKELVMQA